MKYLFAAAITLVINVPVMAEEVSRTNLQIAAVAKTLDRPSNPQYANSTYITFTDSSWFPSVCRGADGVRIPNNDKIALDIALAALTTGKSVTVRVETNRVNSSYCDLTQIAINNQ